MPNIKSPDEFKDNAEQATHRHDKLKSLIDNNEELKSKLTKPFKLIYFFVRLGFISVWAGCIVLLIYFNQITDLESVLNIRKLLY